MGKIEHFEETLEKAKVLQPKVGLLNKLSSVNAEASSLLGQVESLCNEYREILYGEEEAPRYKFEHFLSRLEITEKLAGHLWSLTNLVYFRELMAHDDRIKGENKDKKNF